MSVSFSVKLSSLAQIHYFKAEIFNIIVRSRSHTTLCVIVWVAGLSRNGEKLYSQIILIMTDLVYI